MGVTYFKRFRMEIDLLRTRLPEPSLPEGYVWVPWSPATLDRHADVKYESFRSEIDSEVFPCLGQPAGCRRLMGEIAQRNTFLPQATWLISSQIPPHEGMGGARFGAREGQHREDCGTIQGLAQPGALGAVQNVGIVPQHRGLGLGRALVLKALSGFRDARMVRVYLEVTAKNTLAVQLYRSIGFRLTRTTYKSVESDKSIETGMPAFTT